MVQLILILWVVVIAVALSLFQGLKQSLKSYYRKMGMFPSLFENFNYKKYWHSEVHPYPAPHGLIFHLTKEENMAESENNKSFYTDKRRQTLKSLSNWNSSRNNHGHVLSHKHYDLNYGINDAILVFRTLQFVNAFECEHQLDDFWTSYSVC